MTEKSVQLQVNQPATLNLTLKLAVATTAYYYLSHAYHLCGRFLHGYLRDGRMHYPEFGIAGMFVEQIKEGDLSRELSRKHGFPLYPDIAGALTLGGDKLAVDGVLLIGEHGTYPRNERWQIQYPRYEWMMEIFAAFRKTGSTPLIDELDRVVSELERICQQRTVGC